MAEEIDWKALALQVGSLNGRSGAGYARKAIEQLIGEDNLRKAVEYYIVGQPGSELARSVMWHIHPWSAMKHCYDIYKSEQDIETRRMAIELLRVVADERALRWVPEFLEDEDSGIQTWGVEVLEQLVIFGSVEPADAESFLQSAETHPNTQVRERAKLIRENLNRAESHDTARANDVNGDT